VNKLESITPSRAAALVQEGATLIDVRENHEHAAEHIPGVRHQPLSGIAADSAAKPGDTLLIFHCKSGARTNMHASRLSAAAGNCKAYLLAGGIDAWRRAGLPTSSFTGANGKKKPTLLNRLSSVFR
jgi:rhodanese-related sulfurtransferase